MRHQYRKSIQRIQRILVSELSKIAIVHLYSQGYKDEALVDFELELTNPSTIFEREKVEKVNMADNLIFQTEKQIKEYSEKLTEDDKSLLNTDLEALKKAHSEKDVTAIDETSQKLNSTWQTISTRLYQETQSEPQPSSTDTGNGDVEDTSYEEVK